jgi:predicted nucleic acid-binding protein
VIHLDSSFLIDLLREQRRGPGPARAWLDGHGDEALGVSVFVACELETGAAFAAHPETERAHLRGVLQAITTVYPDHRFAAAYAGLLSMMRPRGRTIGSMDLLIATTAVVDGVALLTGNRKHFEVVPDLRVLSHR